MRIAIPVFSNEGENSEVFGHFGSAPCFIILDTEKMACEAVDNGDKEHAHGMCMPLESFKDKKLDAIVTGGMGLRAVKKVAEAGLKVYRSTQGMTVKEVARGFEAGSLAELKPEDACSGHSCG